MEMLWEEVEAIIKKPSQVLEFQEGWEVLSQQEVSSQQFEHSQLKYALSNWKKVLEIGKK